MRILVTNDDGIKSVGLHMLVKEIEKDNEVYVAAPDSQRSASSHSITLHNPLVVKEVKMDGINSRAFSVSGTPADCVKIALDKLVKEKVDMVLSGINHGLNLGTDVIYSGTVSAAIESSIYKIPSIALSMDINNSDEAYATAAAYAKDILVKAHKNKVPEDIVLNVNMPEKIDDGIEGIKVCNLGNRIYRNYYIEAIMDNMEKGFRLQGEADGVLDEETDVLYISKRYITVTPLHYDLTNFKVINEVRGWF
jgi:5'-nucleotidase